MENDNLLPTLVITIDFKTIRRKNNSTTPRQNSF